MTEPVINGVRCLTIRNGRRECVPQVQQLNSGTAIVNGVRIYRVPSSDGIDPDGITFSNFLFGALQNGERPANIKSDATSLPNPAPGATFPLIIGGTYTVRAFLFVQAGGFTWRMRLYRLVTTPFPGDGGGPFTPVLVGTVDSAAAVPANTAIQFVFPSATYIDGDCLLLTREIIAGAGSPGTNQGGLILVEGASDT